MTLTLDADAIRRIAKNPEVVRQFPFLAPYGRLQSAGCCGRKTYPDARKAVAAVFALPAARRAAFKSALGAAEVVGHVVRAAKVVRVSF